MHFKMAQGEEIKGLKAISFPYIGSGTLARRDYISLVQDLIGAQMWATVFRLFPFTLSG